MVSVCCEVYQYSHDLAGRVKSISGVLLPEITAGSNNISYQENSNHISVQTGTTPKEYLLDANGNTVSDGTHIFHYDALNRITSVEEGGITTAEYAYDAHNHRVKKIVSGTVTLYQYDLSGNLIGETTEDGSPLRDYIYFDGQPFAMKVYGGSEAGLYFFINDHLGTPQRLVTASGASVWEAAYFPFGKAQVVVGTVTNNLRFPGQYYDAETGLHYNWNRYYDPEIGRYISADPIGLDGGINLYAYVSNDPVNFVDPWGLWAFWSGVTGTLASGPASSFSEGAAYDSNTGGYGSYSSTSPDGAGVGSSIGLEFGLYTGTMDGATTTDSINTPLGSGSIIRGSNGELGIAVNFSLSWPVKWGYTHTEDWTSFQDLDWAETMWQTYDEDPCDD